MRIATWAYVGALAVFVGGQPDGALACACCAETGDRFVERVELSPFEREILDSITFEMTADVATGPRDYEDVEGIRVRSLPLDMTVAKVNDEWTFIFDDLAGNAGRLVFALPDSVTRFEVDPHDPNAGQNIGGGPILYKEWRLTAEAVGDGMLSGSVGGGQMATLIFHGRGNHCPNVTDFNAWTLVLYGSRAQVELFGDLKHQFR